MVPETTRAKSTSGSSSKREGSSSSSELKQGVAVADAAQKPACHLAVGELLVDLFLFLPRKKKKKLYTIYWAR